MKHGFALVLLFSAVCVLPAGAQKSQPTPADSAKAKFAGTWEGTYQSDHAPDGGMRLTVARDSVWKATLDISADQPIPTREVTDFEVDGNNVYWNQELMGMPCKSSAVLVDGTLKGETNCGHGGLTFTLRKKERAADSR